MQWHRPLLSLRAIKDAAFKTELCGNARNWWRVTHGRCDEFLCRLGDIVTALSGLQGMRMRGVLCSHDGISSGTAQVIEL